MRLSEEQFNAFIYEIRNWDNIPISSRNCRIGCSMCKVQIDPQLRRYPRLPDIDSEDLIRGFEYAVENHKYLRLGAGVLVAAHTDPFLHPDIYSFIELTSKRFPKKTITTVTTGGHIDLMALNALNDIPNWGIDLSLITMQNQRETLMKLSARAKTLELLKHKRVRKISLMFTGLLDDLRKDLHLLASLGIPDRCHEILLRRIEFTNLSSPAQKHISLRSINNYSEAVSLLRSEFPFVKYTTPYLTPVFDDGKNEYFSDANDRFFQLSEKVRTKLDHQFHIMMPESTYEYGRKFLSHFNNITVYCVPNSLYAGSVTVAGLLTLNDIDKQLEHASIGNKAIVTIPKELFDVDGRDLNGNHWQSLNSRWKVDTWVV